MEISIEDFRRLSDEKAKHLLRIAELERQMACLQSENQMLKNRIGFLEKPTTTIEMHNHFEPGSSNQVFNGDASGKFGTM